MSGYFGIGIENGKTEMNIGTLWRSANIYDASFIFTIGKRYKKQNSDVLKTPRHIPLFNYLTFDEFYKHLPFDCMLVGIEMTNNAVEIKYFKHPKRAVYLLGAEDNGLTNLALSKCHDIIKIPGDHCLNVAVAGSIVLYDRIIKQ